MRKVSKRATIAAMLAMGLIIPLTATGAQALSQITGQCSCSTEIRVASSTVGQTEHRTSQGQYWDKGVRNGGATSYTGYTYLTFVQTDAPTINSSGYACR